jgi:hypothetical protein
LTKRARIYDPESAPPPRSFNFGVVPWAQTMEWDGLDGEKERFTDGDFRVWPVYDGMRTMLSEFPPISEMAAKAGKPVNAFYQFFYRLERAGMAVILYDEKGRITDVVPNYSTQWAQTAVGEVLKERAKPRKPRAPRRPPKHGQPPSLPFQDVIGADEERAPTDKVFIPTDNERAPGRALSYPQESTLPIKRPDLPKTTPSSSSTMRAQCDDDDCAARSQDGPLAEAVAIAAEHISPDAGAELRDSADRVGRQIRGRWDLLVAGLFVVANRAAMKKAIPNPLRYAVTTAQSYLPDGAAPSEAHEARRRVEDRAAARRAELARETARRAPAAPPEEAPLTPDDIAHWLEIVRTGNQTMASMAKRILSKHGVDAGKVSAAESERAFAVGEARAAQKKPARASP